MLGSFQYSRKNFLNVQSSLNSESQTGGYSYKQHKSGSYGEVKSFVL